VVWASCGIFLLALSAYLASAASTTELTSILLPARLRAVKDNKIDAALAVWTTLAAVGGVYSINNRLCRSQQLNVYGMITVAKHSSVNLIQLIKHCGLDKLELRS